MFRNTIWAMVAMAVAISWAGALSGQENSRYEPPQVIAAEEPVYPVNVVNPGTVVLEVTLDPAGEIEAVKVVQAAAGFNEEAQRVIRKWKFAPARLDGKPVRSVIPVVFSFSQPLVWRPGKAQ
ncbi:MAG: energy transducer TonB [Acidobacteria bacterium]|nr:energy transducer TonB [Acidobacteriota bacterium]